jgi:predicted helicase
MWRKGEKLSFVARGEIAWQTLIPDARNTWLVPEHSDEYREFLAITELFDLWSLGVSTARNAVVYDWNIELLSERMQKSIDAYNGEVYRHKANPQADWPDHVKWSEGLKLNAQRGNIAEFDTAKLVPALFRPFTKHWLYFDRVLNERVYQWPKISGPVIVTSDIAWRAPNFSALMTDVIADLHLCATIDAHQCFPLSHLKDSAVEQFRAHYADPSITREDVFHYLYALLHHPAYRERFAASLKRELPRIPLAPDFRAFAAAGRELARLHMDYESLQPWPLKATENDSLPYSERVTKMKLSENKDSIRINESLTLIGIPPETFEYRLGSRSALEWVIDQYQVKGESDPNREDDPRYIVLLVGQVVRVSVETVRIVNSLPQLF